jgi:hypothetical protein
LSDIMRPYERDTPRHHTGGWRSALPSELFAAPILTRFAHRHTGEVEAVIVDRILSVSFIAALPEAERARVERRIRRLLETHSDLRGRSRVSFPYQTHAYCCARR